MSNTGWTLLHTTLYRHHVYNVSLPSWIHIDCTDFLNHASTFVVCMQLLTSEMLATTLSLVHIFLFVLCCDQKLIHLHTAMRLNTGIRKFFILASHSAV